MALLRNRGRVERARRKRGKGKGTNGIGGAIMIPGGLRGALIDVPGEGDCTTTAERVRVTVNGAFFPFWISTGSCVQGLCFLLAIKVCMVSLSLSLD